MGYYNKWPEKITEPEPFDWSKVTDEELWKACWDAEGYAVDMGGNCEGDLKAIHLEMERRLKKEQDNRQ